MPSQCVQSFHDLLLTPPCSPHLAHTLPPPSSPVPRDYNARAAESAGKGATGGLQGSSVCGFVLGIFFIVWSQLHSSDIAACAAEHSFTLGMGITVVTTACVSLCTGCVNCVVACCAKDDADDVDHIGMWCGRCGLRRCSPRAISPALAPQSVAHPSLTLFAPLPLSLPLSTAAVKCGVVLNIILSGLGLLLAILNFAGLIYGCTLFFPGGYSGAGFDAASNCAAIQHLGFVWCIVALVMSLVVCPCLLCCGCVGVVMWTICGTADGGGGGMGGSVFGRDVNGFGHAPSGGGGAGGGGVVGVQGYQSTYATVRTADDADNDATEARSR